jgi:hypothetical protein
MKLTANGNVSNEVTADVSLKPGLSSDNKPVIDVIATINGKSIKIGEFTSHNGKLGFNRYAVYDSFISTHNNLITV